MNADKMLSDLTRDEANRLFVYDDATGLPLKPGVTLIGHPTISRGRALDVHGISNKESDILSFNQINEAAEQIEKRFPAFANLDDVRQRVLVNMAVNMGVAGLFDFHETLYAVSLGNWEAAATAMQSSLWYRKVGARAVRLVAMMRTGKDAA